MDVGRWSAGVTVTGYYFRYGFVLCICFRIRVQETCMPC